MELKKFNAKLLNEADIDRAAVEKSVSRAAMKIFGVVDHRKLRRTIDAAMKDAKDTEDAIQISINMMRG